MEVNKVIFYLNNSPVHTRTVAPFDADYQYTGLTPNTAHELKAEIYSDNTLIDTKLVNITTDTSVSWANLVVADYVARVEADYGTVEDAVVLEADLNTGTEQEYLDAIAIYNPNGGHRTGKIYDVRDATEATKTLVDTNIKDFDVPANSTLTIETVEKFPSNSSDYTYKMTAQQDVYGSVISNQKAKYGFQNGYNISIYAKQGTLRYFVFRIHTIETFFDLQSGVVAKGTGVITDEGNGWYRCSVSLSNSADEIAMNLDISNSPTTRETTGKIGKYVYLGGINVNRGTDVLLPYSRQPKLDLTVTGGGGTRINKDGLVEGIVYNEHSNSNLLTLYYSEGATLTTGQLAPDGSNTATKAEHTVNTYYYTVGLYTTDGTNISVYAKRLQGTGQLRLLLGNFNAYFDIVNGTVISNPENANHVSISDEGDGWFRCSIGHSGANASVGCTVFDLGQIGDITLFWGNQRSNGSSDLKPYQSKTGTAAFPKIEYSTGQPAFLIEPTRTNKALQSKDFGTSPWQPYKATVVANDATAPDGTITATKGVEDTTTDGHVIAYQSISVTSDTYYTLSCYAKAGTNNYFLLRHYLTDNNYANQVFDLSDGTLGEATVGASSGTILTNSAFITPVGNGWYRCGFTAKAIGTSCKPHLQFAKLKTGNTYNATGNAVYTGTSSTLYLWGFQLEDGSTVSSLIPTNGAVVTRTANSLGSVNVSNEVGVYYEIENRLTDDFRVSISNATGSERVFIHFEMATNSIRFFGTSSNGSLGSAYNYSLTNLTKYKFFLRVGANKNGLFMNGVHVHDYSGIAATMVNTDLKFKLSGFDNSRPYYGSLNTLKILPATMTDQEAINLTTI